MRLQDKATKAAIAFLGALALTGPAYAQGRATGQEIQKLLHGNPKEY